MKLITYAAIVLIGITTGCAGPRAFTKGTYEDPKTIALLDDRFNENDMQLIAKKVVNSILEAPLNRPEPAIMLGKMRNRTTEHIDMVALSDKIKTALIQSGKVRFVDVNNRKDIATEYEYQQSGYVDPAQAKAPGKQTGSDLILTGTLSANVQEVGKDKLIYYKATFQLTDLVSSEIIWTDEKEIRKAYKKRSIGL
ncbi:MAG: penicillin-binding protein activator LpoB [Gemmatimonadota bacterium]|nr:penicillin-binding protein activator LpoB [Gemmatimonadota bacterium]MDE2828808.1 penicillin-binding protein activator LpoB [Gemmatimonadota bacterium]